MQVASEPESDGGEHEPEANVLSEPESAASDTEGSYPGYSDWDESDDEDFPHVVHGEVPPLLEAAELGDLERLLSLLNTGVDVNAREVFGMTALMLAASEGHTAFVNALLAAGAAVNLADKGGWIPLHYATLRGCAACVRILIAAGSDVNNMSVAHQTPFSIALSYGHRNTLKILLRAGADVYYTGAAQRHSETTDAEIADAWKLVDAIRKVGGWPEYVRRRRATLGIWVIRKLPTVIEIEIAAFVEPPGGY